MSAALARPKRQQARQRLLRTPVPQKLMVHELVRRGSALHIHAQTNTQESLELLRQLLRLLQSWRAMRGDEVQRLERLFVEVRRLALDHLDGHDAQRPYVDLRAVLLLLNDFRSHPVGCADHGGSLGALLGEFGAEAEVS